ncbi:unnamed protein product [Symbiodinium sp. CCMP2456]|nr:unnamed protein product [Symbiodinium sp. CCMP2456]
MSSASAISSSSLFAVPAAAARPRRTGTVLFWLLPVVLAWVHWESYHLAAHVDDELEELSPQSLNSPGNFSNVLASVGAESIRMKLLAGDMFAASCVRASMRQTHSHLPSPSMCLRSASNSSE